MAAVVAVLARTPLVAEGGVVAVAAAAAAEVAEAVEGACLVLLELLVHLFLKLSLIHHFWSLLIVHLHQTFLSH